MADERKRGERETRQVDPGRIYTLLGALKNSVDQLTVQVRALRNREQEERRE